MFKGVRSRVPLLKQEKVAQKIINAIEKDKIFLTMPWSTRFVRLSQGVLPLGLYDWFTGKVLGIYNTMDHFTGRKN